MSKLKIGVSSCLLNSSSGYNYISFFLNKWFDLVPICPNIICKNSGRSRPNNTLENRLEGVNLVAFILKSDSSKCDFREGSNRVLIDSIRRLYAIVPIETDENINIPAIRDRFIVSLAVIKRWKSLNKHVDSIYDFHNKHKFLLQSFNDILFMKLDSLVKNRRSLFYGDFRNKYEKTLLKLLKNSRKRINIYRSLKRIYEKIGRRLNSSDRYELRHTISMYKRDQIPLLEPITLIRHHVNSLGIDELKDQYFINPSLLEMNLLFHV